MKAGKVTVSQIRDLVGVISREKAQIGAFLSLEPPTSPMRREAASAGFYESPWGKHPRIQLLTIEDLLGGKSIDYPQATDVTFKKAQRVRPNPSEKAEDSTDRRRGRTMTDKPIGQHWRDGAIYFATGRSEEESLEYIRSMPKYVLSILREALEDTGPFKADKVPQEAPEAMAVSDQEAAPWIAAVVAAARLARLWLSSSTNPSMRSGMAPRPRERLAATGSRRDS